ncbi:MAG: N-acetyltransferase [Bacteroidetes bacterium]|nr:MAG: N-acetyltransferase [Bacteroidota bacterium]PTM09595.1 MAG: N-acetyltransferase [Bacteroidota bacterium]
MSNSSPTFRLATANDLPAIVDILNQAIRAGGKAAYTEEIDLAERTAWLGQHPADRWPVYVVKQEDEIAGWCCFSPYRPARKALATLAEITYYLHPRWQGQGLGGQIVDFLVQQGPTLGYRNLFAVIMDTNEASYRLLEKKGFQRWGHLPEVAILNGQVCGQVYYGRALATLK